MTKMMPQFWLSVVEVVHFLTDESTSHVEALTEQLERDRQTDHVSEFKTENNSDRTAREEQMYVT